MTAISERDRLLLLDRSCLTINSRPLADYGLALASGGVTVGESKPVTAILDVPGLSGGVDVTLRDPGGRAVSGRRTITATVVAAGDPMQIAEAKRLIGALHATVADWANLDATGCHWHGLMAVGAWDDKTRRAADGDVETAWSECDLTLDAEPYTYGHADRRALTKGVNTIRIRGNTTTPPRCRLHIDEPGDAWVRDTATGLHVTVHATRLGTLTLDAATYTATLEGAMLPVTLDSTWFPLPPGVTRLECSHPGLLETTPRWML